MPSKGRFGFIEYALTNKQDCDFRGFLPSSEAYCAIGDPFNTDYRL